MTHAMVRTVLFLALTSLPCLVLPACQTGHVEAQHKEASVQANERWRSLRTKLLLQTAQRQFDTGDLDQADRTLLDALNIDPKSARLHLLAGRVMLERNQLERASKFFTTAIECDEKLPEAHYYQGLILQRWQRFDDAFASYDKAYALQSDNPAYLLAKTEMLVRTDHLDDAISILNEKLTYFDQNAGIRLSLAHLYLLKKDYSHAVDFFRQASLLRPDDTQITENLASSLIAAGQVDAGVKELEQLLVKPTHTQRYDLQQILARGYEQSGRPAAARTLYIKLANAQPNEYKHWASLAQICLQLEDFPGTQSAAQRMIELSPQSDQGHLLLGMAAWKQNHLDQALSAFDKAASISPHNAQPLLLRGLALEQAGRTSEAALAYAQAQERQPADERAKRLSQRLSEHTQTP